MVQDLQLKYETALDLLKEANLRAEKMEKKVRRVIDLEKQVKILTKNNHILI